LGATPRPPSSPTWPPPSRASPRWTGSAGELAAAAAAFGAHYAKVPGKDGSTTIDHTLKTYILDAQAQLAVPRIMPPIPNSATPSSKS
jgi:cytochrome oxidase Cu insertion factor (SCO1/SenC/PrrC family)